MRVERLREFKSQALKRNELKEMDLKNGEREDKNLKWSTVKCHSRYQEANFAMSFKIWSK